MTLKKLINEIEELEEQKVSLQTQLDECKAEIRDTASAVFSTLQDNIFLYEIGENTIENIKQDFEHIDKFMKLYEDNSYEKNDDFAKMIYNNIKNEYDYIEQPRNELLHNE